MQTLRRRVRKNDGWVQIADATAVTTIQVLTGACYLVVTSGIPDIDTENYHALDRWTTLSEDVVAYIRAGTEETVIVVSTI